MVPLIAILLVLLTVPAPLTADQGHQHDELTPQELGAVHFLVSCSPAAQKHFDEGVALLHSFAFDTAERTFRQVLNDDEHCAMAHWGIAKSLWRWDTPDASKREQGLAEINAGNSLCPRTSRERSYLGALGEFYIHPKDDEYRREGAFTTAMERLRRAYPDDHEAAAFYAWSLIATDDNTHANRRKASVILEQLFKLEPNHPGVAHYLIHCYDIPGMAAQGLPAARRYAKIAPAAPHALHMPSHIFARLGLWQEDIDSNLASIAASRNAAVTNMEDEGHQYHAMAFLIYAYLQSGRDEEARQLIEEVKSLPKMKNMYGVDFDPQVSALVSFSGAYALELHHWNEAEGLPQLSAADDPDTSITYKARAIGAARAGDLPSARTNLQAIENLHATLVREKKRQMSIDAVDEDRRVALAWIDHAEHHDDEALGILRELANKEQGIFEPDGGTPAHEMLGDILLEIGDAEQALIEYEAELKFSPNRFNSLCGAGRAAELSKQPNKASDYYQQLLKATAGGNSTRRELAEAREFLSTVARQN
jgi:tetratricopeptide (TPR) repeat protein